MSSYIFSFTNEKIVFQFIIEINLIFLNFSVRFTTLFALNGLKLKKVA